MDAPNGLATYREFENWAAQWAGSLPYHLRADRFRLLRPSRRDPSRREDLIPTWKFLMIAMQEEADELRATIEENRQVVPLGKKVSRQVFARMCVHAYYSHKTSTLFYRARRRLKKGIALEAKKWLMAWTRSQERNMLHNAMSDAILEWYAAKGTMCCFW